ncbi:hypothetical protein EG329_006193 [Mollisiaceae sp. DMI_Dod_QoI]|nr:hypothetical protein EG329_006193 [Helotiales sp. DMI_Dod_QoI]
MKHMRVTSTDGDLASEEPQSSTLEVYKDAFVPQPRRRTRAWDRAPVDAHAPRLQGQKIWKKVGHKTPHDDKENFEAALAELEKSGVGARKKQRIMGAKENINNPQWQLMEEGKYTNAKILQSPRKNGHTSMTNSNEDALLVPRKRTNANHLITPRKPLKKISNGIHADATLFAPSAESEMNLRLDDETEPGVKYMDVSKEAPFTNSPKVTKSAGLVENASEEPVRRRKSLRKSTRRLTQNMTPDSFSDGTIHSLKLSAPSTAICSATSFEVFRVGTSISETARQSMEAYGTSSVQELVATEEDRDNSTQITNDYRETSLPNICLGLVESTENGSDTVIYEHVEEPSDTPGNKQIMDEASPALLAEDNTGVNGLNTSIYEASVTTPSRAINTELEFVPAIATGLAATISSTPSSQRKTSRRGSRRSMRALRSDRVSLSAQGVGSSAINVVISSGQAASPLTSRGVDCPTTRPQELEDFTVFQHSNMPTTESTSVDTPREASEVYPDYQELTFGNGNCMSGENEAENITITASECFVPSLAHEIMEMEASPESIQQQSQPSPLEVKKTESWVEIVIEAATNTEETSSETHSAFPDDIEASALSQGETNIVNLFPAVQSPPNHDNEPADPESDEASNVSADNSEVVKAITAASIEDTCVFQGNTCPDYAEGTISPDTTWAGPNRDPSGTDLRPLVDHDDTDLLRDFVTRVKANKAAKAATGLPKRKRSLPHSPIRLPLGTEANVSPSTSEAKEDDFDVSEPANSSNKRRKHDDHALDEDELAEPRSTRRSGRTRLPVKTPLAAPSFIPVRRLGQDSDNTITLRRNEEKELAALTRVNTRKNKGAAVHPTIVLAKKAEEKDDPASRQRALKEVFDEKAQKQKHSKKGKNVVWAEELTQFQTEEGKKLVLEKEVEKEQPVEEKKKTSVKVGMRSKMTLGMAANGTPAPKKKIRGRS